MKNDVIYCCQVVKPILLAGLNFSMQDPTAPLRTSKYVWAQSWAGNTHTFIFMCTPFYIYIYVHPASTHNHEAQDRGSAVRAGLMISLSWVPRMMTCAIKILTLIIAILTLMAMKTRIKNLIPSFFSGVAPSGSWRRGGRPVVRGERHQHGARGGEGRHQGKRQ